MPRLLFVVNDAPFFLSHRLPLALGAQASGFEVHVATPEHPRAVELSQLGLTFHPIPLKRSTAALLTELRSLHALARLYRMVAPDIVHHVTHKPVLYGSLAARAVGVPAVVNAISGLGFAFVAEGKRAAVRRGLMLQLYRHALRHPRSVVIFQNRDDSGLFERAGAVRAEQVLLIPGSGVDLERFVPVGEPTGPVTVVFPARMLLDKGLGEFVAAIAQVRRQGVEIRALLAGDPDPENPRSVTQAQLRAWVTTGTVEWLGHRSDMEMVLAAAHVVCLPSYREGVPKSLLEAAAAGRAIITTDVPGCRDVVSNEVNGLLVPPGKVEPLVEALLRLIRDPSLRARMGAAGRRRAELEFGIQSVVSTTLGIYAKLLDSAI